MFGIGKKPLDQRAIELVCALTQAEQALARAQRKADAANAALPGAVQAAVEARDDYSDDLYFAHHDAGQSGDLARTLGAVARHAEKRAARRNKRLPMRQRQADHARGKFERFQAQHPAETARVLLRAAPRFVDARAEAPPPCRP